MLLGRRADDRPYNAFPGFRNLGNTCFLNSQCARDDIQVHAQGNGTLGYVLAETMTQYISGELEVMAPLSMLKALIDYEPDFGGGPAEPLRRRWGAPLIMNRRMRRSV